METLQKVCLVFTILGGIVWGLIGLFDYNIVTAIFNATDAIPRVIYSIVGLCALINIGLFFTDFRENRDRK